MPGETSAELERLRQGSQDAIADLDRLLRSRLLNYIRLRRNPALRHKIDSEGLVNSVLKSVLPNLAGQQYPEVIDSKTLNDLLYSLVRSAMRDEWRYWCAIKRDARREVSADDSALPVSDRIYSRPEYTAEINDCLEAMYAAVETLGDDAVTVWHEMLNGLSRGEIAEKSGLTAGQVGNLQRRIKEQCRALMRCDVESEGSDR